MKRVLHNHTIRRLFVAAAGVAGVVAVSAGPASAGLRNHSEPIARAR